MQRQRQNSPKQLFSSLSIIIIALFVICYSTFSQEIDRDSFPLKKKKIIVGGDNNYPPFEFIDEKGNPAGFNVELTKAIARKINIDVEFKLMPWYKIFDSIEKNEIDIIQGIFYSDARAQKLDFSQPYLVNHYVAVINKKSKHPLPESFENLKNLKVSVQNHDIAHETLKEKGYTNIFPEENMEEAIRGVINGKYDCALVSRLAALHFIQKNNWKNYLALPPNSIFSARYSYAVKKSNIENISYFIEGLRMIEESSEYNTLINKWFVAPTKRSQILEFLTKYILIVLLVILLPISIIIIWNMSLKKMLNAKIADLNRIENRYKQIFEGSRDGIVMVNPDSKITDANPAFCRITGYSLDELKNITFYDITPQKWHKWEKEEIWDKRLLKNGWTGIYEKEYITKEKRIIPIEVQAYTVFDENHNPIYLWGVVRDITERKKQEAEIQKRLAFEFLTSRISSLAISSDNTADFIRKTILTLSEKINTSAIYCLQYSTICNVLTVSFEWKEPGIPSLMYPPLNVDINQLFPEEFKTKSQLIIIPELKESAKDNPFLSHLLDNGVKSLCAIPIFNVNNLFAYILLLEYRAKRVWDNIEIQTFNAVSQIATNAISKLKSEEKQKLLLTAIEFSEEVIVITNKSGVIEYVNPEFEKVTGYSREEVIGKTPGILKSGKQSRDFYSELWKTISSAKTWHGRFVNKKKDGSLYTEDAVISPVLDKSGEITHYIAIKQDVTAQLKLEEQFIMAQKMESVGKLAGGIAHDFNNMLAVILGFCEIASAKLKDNSSDIESDLKQIHDAATRSTDMTKHLLAFSRKQITNPEALNPNLEIEKLLKIIKRLIGDEIKITFIPKDGLPQIYIDPVQFQQVLINLCINARDAMDKPAPEIKISTDLKVFSNEFCKDNPDYMPGSFVEISCADNGHGMDSELIKHIFEPFFTTKQAGKGTGLGLSIVYNILKQNNGFIKVSSTPGTGSNFSLYLPVYNQNQSTDIFSNKNFKTNITSTNKKQVAMIVEDEPNVLTLCKSILQKDFSIITASNASDALQKAKNTASEIHLLLTDVIMPDMNGFELAKAIKGIHPEAKVLFMSGYTDDYLSQRGLEEIESHLIHKPFTTAQLLGKISEILNQNKKPK